MRRYTTVGVRRSEAEYGIESTAYLEGTAPLQILAFEEQLCASKSIQVCIRQDRRVRDVRANARGSRTHIGNRYGQA
jgi:hypothetical protein